MRHALTIEGRSTLLDDILSAKSGVAGLDEADFLYFGLS